MTSTQSGGKSGGEEGKSGEGGEQEKTQRHSLIIIEKSLQCYQAVLLFNA